MPQSLAHGVTVVDLVELRDAADLGEGGLARRVDRGAQRGALLPGGLGVQLEEVEAGGRGHELQRVAHAGDVPRLAGA